MKKYIIIALLAVLTLSSCKDFLVKEPIMEQSTELTLSDYNGLNKSVAGAYARLADGVWYGTDYVLTAELRAGNAKNPTDKNFTSGRMTQPYNMTYNASSTEGLWSYAYATIAACNNIITAIGENGENIEKLIDGRVSEEDVKNILGEAKALRAFSHFDLLRLYARTDGKTSQDLGISIITTPQLPTDKPARNSVAECFKQIITDLTSAEELMSDDYQRSGVADDKATINKNVVRALLSRVYLYNKDYQKAADYATLVIKSGDYKMWTEEEYTKVWSAEVGGSEVIFEVYGKQGNTYDEYWEGPSHMTNPKGYADVAASPDLVALFEEGDVRGTKGVRGTDDGKVMFCTDEDEASGGELWTMKYQGKGEGNATSTPDVTNVIVLRLSEMYLNRAEALANGAAIAGETAVGDLNTIRSNRGASALGSAGLTTIAAERRMELNFEGHLWFDLARTGSSITYSDAKERGGITGVPADSKFWAMPIPKSQIDINENLVQNPGY